MMLTSRVVTPVMYHVPSPCQPKTILGEDGAAEHGGEVQCDDRRDGDQRIAQHVADEHSTTTQSLGPSQAHVVGVERLNHRRALVDGPGRVGDQYQCQGRQRGVCRHSRVIG